MKITKSFFKAVGGSVLLMFGYNLVLSAVAESNREFGYNLGRIDGFSEGREYSRRRGINNENKNNNNPKD